MVEKGVTKMTGDLAVVFGNITDDFGEVV